MIIKKILKMKVSELIKNLQKLPQELEVIVNGYENGFDDVIEIELKHIDKNINTNWWDGRHEQNNESKIKAVYLKSNRR